MKITRLVRARCLNPVCDETRREAGHCVKCNEELGAMKYDVEVVEAPNWSRFTPKGFRNMNKEKQVGYLKCRR